jgi:hypothetical protein
LRAQKGKVPAMALCRTLLKRFSVLSVLLLLAGPAAAADGQTFDFTGYTGGSVLSWLQSKGFQAKQDASSNKVVYTIDHGDLNLQAKQKALALLLSEANLIGFTKVRITWGVEQFPQGASYENGVRSDPLMIYLFFGDQKISSGSMLVPDSPYFIGLFPCQSDPVGKPYKGRYFKAGGRYVCADHATAGQTLTTTFNFDDAFKKFFNQTQTPYVSGFGIGIDTDAAKGNGTASSFVQSIEFLD